ncbi:hypothetical protein M5689_000313 [Euphorbia peplus]|nr:hypothetical protein M5689_000313 [Euphorbia peplus]
MAEAFLYDIGRTVLGKLTSLALQQFFLARGLQSEIDEIKNTMFAINAVLLDAEQRQSQSHAIQVWLTELKDVLYDTEDAADEFEYEARRRQVVAESAGKGESYDSLFCEKRGRDREGK